MATTTDTVRIVIDSTFKGGGAFNEATSQIKGLEQKATGMGAGIGRAFGGLNTAVLGVGLAFGTMAVAAGKAYSLLREGAALQTTTERFDKLSASIGSTADAMLTGLRGATQGMISDAELMASASQIMSLKLADNAEQVTRLATVAGTLGWDMQQVILTFANMSTMRLDALGLSVEDVKNKAAELEKAGMSATEAFKEAVILAGEARLEIGGVSETEQAFKQAEAAVANFKTSIMASTIATLDQAGAFDALSNAALRLNLVQQIKELDTQLRESGQMFDSLFEKILRSNDLSKMSTAELQSEVILLNNAVLAGQDAWARNGGYAIQVMQDMRAEARATAAAMNAAFMSAARGGNMGWAGGDVEPFDYTGAAADRNARLRRRVQSAQNRARQEDARMDVKAMRGDWDRAAESAYSYGGAVSYVNTEEQALADTHARMLSAFQSELSGDAAAGLINAEGKVNVEAMNQALYDQASAAGASATTLAMLGVATGQFTEEQAAAALKAAVLQEQIVMVAKAVAAGQMSMGDALSSLSGMQMELDATDPAAGLDATIAGLVQAVDEDSRTIQFLTNTDMVDDDIERFSNTIIDILVRYVPTNSPTDGASSSYSGPVSNPSLYTAYSGGNVITAPTGGGGLMANVVVNINGSADPGLARTAVRDGLAEFWAGVSRQGVHI